MWLSEDIIKFLDILTVQEYTIISQLFIISNTTV